MPTVVGPKVKDTISLNILTGSTNTISCDSFGFVGGSLYNLRDLVSAPFDTHAGKSIVATIDNLKYSDPTLATVPLDIPRIQSSPKNPVTTKYKTLDYTIQNSQISFSAPTEGTWYAEFGLFDENVIYNNFGADISLTKEVASEEYLNRVRGIYYSLLTGPTISSIRTRVLATLGLPMSVEAGTVSSINTNYSGQKGQIVIGTKGYLYPLSVGTSLSVGDSVSQFAPLCNGVNIYDYINNPTWFDSFPAITEIQKYHTFLVSLDLDALDIGIADYATAISRASSTLSIIKPTYKDFIFLGTKSFYDVSNIDDFLLVQPRLFIADAITEPYPVYDDKRFYSFDYDWAYDQELLHGKVYQTLLLILLMK